MSSSSELRGQACFVNIGPRQRRLRLRLGVGALVGALGLIVVDVARGLPALAGVATVALVFGGFAGVLQAREKT